MDIKNRLGYIRQTQNGLTQEELARKSGISRHTISEIELGKREPKLRTALTLANALECSVDDIFYIRGG